MTSLNQYKGKVDGQSTLTAAEWNGAMDAIQTAITTLETNGGSGTESGTRVLQYITKTEKNNLNIEAPAEWKDPVTGKGGKLNLEAANDIQLKPGDDIVLYSHHRASGNQEEITLKVAKTLSDNTDAPVKLLLNTANITLTTKDKDLRKINSKATKSESDILDLNVNTGLDKQSGNNTKAYLKVRARAIDLRCEEHGGIALQPKGLDSTGKMNKIKFEHGGGDGLEFATFNTEKTSIFTDEYRFNKDGIWKQATRTKVVSDKADANDPTTAYKYLKQTDDFYDVIDPEDAYTTTKHLIKTAHALNTAPGMKTEISGAGNCKISAATYYTLDIAEDLSDLEEYKTVNLIPGKVYEKSDLKDQGIDGYITTGGRCKLSGYGTDFYSITVHESPKIGISSDEEVEVSAKLGDVVITSGDTIKMEAPEIRLNAINSDKSGGLVNMGATSKVQFLTSKFTKSGNIEASEDAAKITLGVENNSTKVIYLDSEGVAHRASDVIYMDPTQTELYDPTNHQKEKPIYYSDGTLVSADTTLFTIKDNQVYKFGTKGSEAITSKSNTLIATIVDGVYIRLLKSDGVTYYNAKLQVEATDYTGEGLKEIAPGSVVEDQSVDVADIALLVNYMKQNHQGPWA